MRPDRLLAILAGLALAALATPAAAVTTYDYSNRTQGTNIFAYDGADATQVPTNNTTPSTVLSSGEYVDIETDDASSHVFTTSTNNDYSMTRFVIEIDETEASVTQLSPTWIGKGTNANNGKVDGARLYIWNYGSSSYTLVQQGADTESEVTLTGDLTSSLTDYIGGGSSDTVTLLVVSDDKTNGNKDNSLYTDYVKLAVTAGASGPDHFAISHDGTAVNCQAENVTITAHDASHSTETGYTGTITLSTSTSHGDWSLVTGSGTLTNSGGGAATYAYDASDSGAVVLGLTNTYAETVNINVTGDSASEDASEDSDLVYAAAGFQWLADSTASAIGTQIGGKASNVAPGSQTLELQAIKTSDSSGACEAALTGSNTIQIAFECENPTTCTANQVSVSGTDVASNPNGSVTSYTNVSLDFGDASDTTATLTLSYPDVGQIQMHAKYTLSPSGELMTGASNSFVWRPFAFDVSATGNPGATDHTGSVFTTAGTNFTGVARAVLWASADDTGNDGQADGHGDANPANNADLTNNTAALNYGNETATENVALSAVLFLPSGGNDPGLTGGTSISSFTSGSGSTTTAHYDEVGIAELSGAVSDGNYLGIGTTDTSKILGKSGHVGRFKPYDFSVSLNTPQFTPGCSAGSFTYVGSVFSYGTAPVITTTARSAIPTTTQNYTGDFWKLTNSSLTGRSYTAATGTLDTSGLLATTSDPNIADSGSGVGTLTFSAGTGLLFTKGAETAPFDADIALSINVIDSDSVAYASNPVTFGTATTGNGIAFSGSKTQRWGRMTFENAHGSELVALSVPFRAEYYDGNSFLANTADGCTATTVANLTKTPTPGALSSTAAIANNPLSSSSAGLTLSAPGSGNTGYFTLSFDLTTATGASLPWLQYDWDGDSSHDDNPTGRATFGVYLGDDEVIHIRELY